MEQVSFFDAFWNGVLETSWVEWAAVLSGVLYLVFVSLRMMICWLFAFISSLLYVYICYSFDLFIETGLQVFYVVMAVYGWLSWQRSEGKTEERVAIRTWKVHHHVVNIAASGVVVLVVGWLFDTYTNQANPYLDAFTTVFSLVATFMVTQRVLENWIYWIVIDAVSIALYTSRGLYLSSILYLLFTVLAVVGFIAWLREYKPKMA